MKQVRQSLNSDGYVVEKDTLEQYDEILNDDNLINDNDNILDASSNNVGIDDHFILPLNIYNPLEYS